jgi:hypothetical protein
MSICQSFTADNLETNAPQYLFTKLGEPCVCPICDGTGVMPEHVQKARSQAGMCSKSGSHFCVGCNGTGVVK